MLTLTLTLALLTLTRLTRLPTHSVTHLHPAFYHMPHTGCDYDGYTQLTTFTQECNEPLSGWMTQFSGE